jgi:peptidoglycan/xylan/chitin deacetylase (PgdA/CDA1 family)
VSGNDATTKRGTGIFTDFTKIMQRVGELMQFSLTLALSRWEREKPSARRRNSHGPMANSGIESSRRGKCSFLSQRERAGVRESRSDCDELENFTKRSGREFFTVKARGFFGRRNWFGTCAASVAAGSLALCFVAVSVRAAERAPDGVVVLTFDDSVASHATFVGPLLKKLGFGATFFITEGFEFATDKEHYMTWEQIKGLHDAGFEIGNHTRRHAGVAKQPAEQLRADVEYIEQQCEKHGIPRPTSFCYPAYQTSEAAVKLLRERGYRVARAGGARAFDPAKDEPLTMPQAFDGKPASTLDEFKAAVAKAKDGQVAVMTFHGVPDIKHPWVNTEPARFESYMNYLKEQKCRVIAARDLGKFLAERR